MTIMKTKLFIAFIAGAFFMLSTVSCDKVENPFPPTFNSELDTTYYSGNWSDYLANEWPDFTTLPNDDPNRNALIEDFTGHNCSNCPAAATVAHNLHEGNPSRVYVASMHSSPAGMSGFQQVNESQGYTVDFTNPNGLELGTFFGDLSGSGFFGNPAGTVNRALEGTEYFYASGFWSTKVNQILSSALKVNIKAKVNFYDANKGGYLHTEVEVIDPALTNELGQVVYLIEDSLVGPQNVSSTYTPDYVHRDIFRKTLSGQSFGRTLSATYLTNGKYYLDYSFSIPNQLAPINQTGTYNAENMHLLIYVYDKVTLEIYQVIKKKLI
jgi:hypothetical protein